MERKVKYNVAFRHKHVKLVTENHHSINFVAQKFGVNPSQVKRWFQNYRELGLNGLISRVTDELRKKDHPQPSSAFYIGLSNF